jgi:hypothetical protein
MSSHSYTFNKEELAIIIDMMEKLSVKCEPKSCADLVMDSINDNSRNYGNVQVDWKVMNKFTDKIDKYEKMLKGKK